MKLRRTIYAALLLFSVVLISLFGGTVSYALFFAMVLIPVVSLVYLIVVFAQFTLYQNVDSKDVVANTPTGYYFILKNDGFVSFSSVQIRMFSSFSEIEELPEESEFCLVPEEQYKYETRLFGKYRGEYQVGIKEVILTDFLRLFRFRYKIPSTIKANVAPNLITLTSAGCLDEIITLSSNDTMNSSEEMDTVVREYMPGDSLRNINWKMTAKEGRLLTRKTIGEKKQGICALVDGKRYSKDMAEYLPLEDQLLKTMLAVNLYIAKQDIALEVLSDRPETTFRISNLGHFNEFYSAMGQYRFVEEFSITEVLEKQRENLSKYGVMILFVHELTEQMIMLIHDVTRTGTNVIVYLISDEAIPAGLNEMLQQNSFRGKVVQIPVHASLEEVLL